MRTRFCWYQSTVLNDTYGSFCGSSPYWLSDRLQLFNTPCKRLRFSSFTDLGGGKGNAESVQFSGRFSLPLSSLPMLWKPLPSRCNPFLYAKGASEPARIIVQITLMSWNSKNLHMRVEIRSAFLPLMSNSSF